MRSEQDKANPPPMPCKSSACLRDLTSKYSAICITTYKVYSRRLVSQIARVV